MMILDQIKGLLLYHPIWHRLVDGVVGDPLEVVRSCSWSVLLSLGEIKPSRNLGIMTT